MKRIRKVNVKKFTMALYLQRLKKNLLHPHQCIITTHVFKRQEITIYLELKHRMDKKHWG